MYKGYLTALKEEDFEFMRETNRPDLNTEKSRTELQKKEHQSDKKNFIQYLKEPLSPKSEIITNIESTDAENLLNIMLSFAEDKTTLIRNKIIEIICQCVHKLPRKQFDQIVSRLLLKWTSHRSFMYRISAIHLVALLGLLDNFPPYSSHFSSLLKNGLKEKVVNVKLCLLRLIGLINQRFPELTHRNHQLRILLGFLEGDIDKNVSTIASMIQQTFVERLTQN